MSPLKLTGNRSESLKSSQANNPDVLGCEQSQQGSGTISRADSTEWTVVDFNPISQTPISKHVVEQGHDTTSCIDQQSLLNRLVEQLCELFAHIHARILGTQEINQALGQVGANITHKQIDAIIASIEPLIKNGAHLEKALNQQAQKGNLHILEKDFLTRILQASHTKGDKAVSITIDTNKFSIEKNGLPDQLAKITQNSINQEFANALLFNQGQFLPSKSLTISFKLDAYGEPYIDMIRRNQAQAFLQDVRRYGINNVLTGKTDANGVKSISEHATQAALIETLVAQNLLGDRYEETLITLMHRLEQDTVRLPVIEDFTYNQQTFKKGTFIQLNYVRNEKQTSIEISND